jgi:hypothetical protein
MTKLSFRGASLVLAISLLHIHTCGTLFLLHIFVQVAQTITKSHAVAQAVRHWLLTVENWGSTLSDFV